MAVRSQKYGTAPRETTVTPVVKWVLYLHCDQGVPDVVAGPIATTTIASDTARAT